MKSSSRKWIVIGIVLIVVVSLFFAKSDFFVGSSSESESNQVGLNVGNLAPDFSLEDINGNSFSLDDYQDRFVVLDFMATWCTPCKIEMDELKMIYEKYGEDNVVIISIDVDPTEKNKTIRDFKQEFGDDWIFASGPRVGVEYEVSGIPTLYILSTGGEIVFKKVGIVSANTISDIINDY